MGFFSDTATDRSRAEDRQRRSAEREQRRKFRAAKAKRRRDWIAHPVRTAWRSR
jgi:hypothetical protein